MDHHTLPNPESDDRTQSAVIKVFGVGGGGCNALEQMIAAGIRDVEFKCINTDAQALRRFAPENVITLGNNITKGLGAGANPEVGTAAAAESTEEIAAAIGGADMLFLTAGMGGGTGTGAIPLIAKTAREMGVLTVAVVTEPFAFEGEKRKATAAVGLEALRENADSMIVVPNENLLAYLGPDVTLVDAFAAANDVVANAVQSIAELITTSGLINVDFADVKTVMSAMGHAIMSTGRGMGEHRAEEAAIGAIKSPLLNNVDLKAAKGILANITSSADLSMGEFQAVGNIIRQIAADDATVVIGTVFDESMSHEMKVTVVATGLKPPKSNDTPGNNDELAAKLTQPTPTASEKAATEAEAAANEAKADAAEARAEAEAATAEAKAAIQAVARVKEEQAKSQARNQALNQANNLAEGRSTVPAINNAPADNQAATTAAPVTGTTADLIAPSEKLRAVPPPVPPATAQNGVSQLADTPLPVPVDDVCMICGCVNGAHLDKCPWANGGPSAEQRKKQANQQSSQKGTQKPNSLLHMARSHKKIGLSVAAAGLVALATVWLVLGKKQADNSIVETPPVKAPSNYIGDLRSSTPYNIPTLTLDEADIEAAEKSGDTLMPQKDDARDRTPSLAKKRITTSSRPESRPETRAEKQAEKRPEQLLEELLDKQSDEKDNTAITGFTED